MKDRLLYISKEKAEELVKKTTQVNNDKKGGNSRAFIFENYVVLQSPILLGNINGAIEDSAYERVIRKLIDLKKSGINVVPILGYMYDENIIKVYSNIAYSKGIVFQQRARGSELWDSKRMPKPWTKEVTNEEKQYLLERTRLLAEASQIQYDKWVSDYKTITDSGIMVDPSKKTNFFYDKEEGFSFIDINNEAIPLYDREDLLSKKNHRYFIIECLLPCHNYRPIDETFLSDEEKRDLIRNNIIIFKKCVEGLMKVGITIDDLKESFENQNTDRSFMNGLSVYGLNHNEMIEVINSIKIEKIGR